MSEDAKWNGAVTTTAGIILGVIVTSSVAFAGGDHIKASDWLQFAGTIFGSLIALGAALVAWLAMQRQVSAHQQSFSLATDEHRKRMVRLLHLINADVVHAMAEAEKKKKSLDNLGPMAIPAVKISNIPGISTHLQDADIWRLSRMQVRLIEDAQQNIYDFNERLATEQLWSERGAIVQNRIEQLYDILHSLYIEIESNLRELDEPRKALPGQKFLNNFYLR
ncbi:hypothetical protein V5F44_21050 [Xanthobacter sp. V2C-8]|uniref:hypothetical protein n=1 Tax=Xanthobacter albus TaxID=3119929 RepID=UPI00372B6F68